MSEKQKTDRSTYFNHISEVTKPFGKRLPVASGRKGNTVPRRHHLLPAKQDQLLRQIKKENRFISPFKRFGAYDGLVCALARLGENESHNLGRVINEVQIYMSDPASRDKNGKTAWDRFSMKAPRSKETARDLIGKMKQNAIVLQRLGGEHPYSLKLAQIGCCLDIVKGENDEYCLRLRTGIPAGSPVKPINEFRVRDCPRTVSSIPSQIRFDDLKEDKVEESEDIGRYEVSVLVDDEFEQENLEHELVSGVSGLGKD